MSNVLTGVVQISSGNSVAAFREVANSSAKAEQSLKKLSPVSNQATLALSNLGRVAQDAPFGFIGIANNLNPLLESFQRLKVSTGTTGGALKALGTSMLGPAGLGVALSIVSSLLITFGDRLFSAGGSVSKFGKILAEAKDEFVSAVSNVEKLRTEIDLAKQGFISKEGVVKTYNETIGKTTGFVKSLDEAEQGLNKNADAYIQFTLKKAVANIAYGKAAEKAFKIQENLQKASEISKSNENLGLDKYLKITALDKLDKANKKLQSQSDSFEDIARSAEKAAAEISKAFGFNFFQDTKTPKAPKGFDLDRWVKDWLSKFPKLQVPISPEFTINQQEIKFVMLGGDLKTFQEQVSESINKDIAKLVVAPRFNFSAEFLANRENQQAMADAAQRLTDTFAQSIGTGMADALVAVGEGIGNVLSGENFGAEIFQVFGTLIQQLGKALIQFAVIDEIIKKILANPLTIGPGVALAAGLAAIAVGALIKNIAGKRAAGGPVSGGQTYLVGEKGPELFTPNTGGQIIPNNQLGGGAGAFGGGVSVQVSGAFQVNGNDLVLVLARANQSQRRLTGR